MAGPAENGAIIYANDVNALAKFYEALFDMHITKQTHDFVSLDRQGFTIIVHVPPVDLPDTSFNPIKLFLTVDDMAQARQKAVSLGGHAFDGEWANPIFKVSNIADSDGNPIQIREFL